MSKDDKLIAFKSKETISLFDFENKKYICEIVPDNQGSFLSISLLIC